LCVWHFEIVGEVKGICDVSEGFIFFITSLLYEGENWTVSRDQLTRIAAAEMWFLRPVAG
jgi:hypothetical protein